MRISTTRPHRHLTDIIAGIDMRRKKNAHCEWCGHEIAYTGTDVPYFCDDDNDITHVLCEACFLADDADVREMIENIMVADIEFFGEYEEDDF